VFSGKTKEVQSSPASQPTTGVQVNKTRGLGGHVTDGGRLEDLGRHVTSGG
jgi:hypothetical protein